MERCSFCGKNIQQVTNLIKSPINDIYICDSCISIADDLISSNRLKEIQNSRYRNSKKQPPQMKLIKEHISKNDVYYMSPHEIYDELNRFIVGQDYVKKSISVALSSHLKRIHNKSGLLKKSNILMIGESGTGKTLIAQTVANILKLPLAIVDASRMTAPGYVGDDTELCLQRLIQKANGNISLAEKGIIYIDEIDKLARSNENVNHSSGCSGTNVQATLLKMIEGCEVSIPMEGKKSTISTNITIDTKNILFICGGAFADLTDNTIRTIGFNAVDNNLNSKQKSEIIPQTLIQYGLMHELVGRLPIILQLNTLKENDLLRIMTEPEDSIIKEYELLFNQYGVKLAFENDALIMAAKMAFENGTGARGIRAILEPILQDIIFDIDKNPDIAKYIITKDTITTKIPIVKKRRKRAEKVSL